MMLYTKIKQDLATLKFVVLLATIFGTIGMVALFFLAILLAIPMGH